MTLSIMLSDISSLFEMTVSHQYGTEKTRNNSTLDLHNKQPASFTENDVVYIYSGVRFSENDYV
jgi:hypothetical protein